MFMLSLHGERLGDIVLTERVDLKQLPGSAPSLPHYRIELVDAGFRYGPDEPWVFRQLNVSIAQGEHVAITGISGCGKSTLAKVILGLLELSEGRLIIGGKDVTEAPLQIDGIVGTVMQEDMLLSGSLLDNISFFDDQASMERVERAATLAQISDEIEALPMKYLTLVGEAGGTLSGGQKQRVLLARALYREPKVLILDEATSHLDTRNEARVNAAISQLRMTRISIAHRQETINSADRVIRLPLENVSIPNK
jgi:ATP-binding cassette subfamily B protein RaxB